MQGIIVCSVRAVQSRCERRQPGFLGTRWRPALSRPLRFIANSVERLIANWAQSSSVVSQGFEGDMAAEAAGVGAAGEATQRGQTYARAIHGGSVG